MPVLHEGSEPTGQLRPELARRWGMRRVVAIAGGGGDQAAGAIGVGVVEPGQAFLALGTSGVFFVAADAFAPNPAQAVHAFCHCLPGRWHQMSVVLSAASCLAWVAALTGARDEAALLAEVAACEPTARGAALPPLPVRRADAAQRSHAKGVFFGLTHEHGRASSDGLCVLEGVAFALADGQEALLAAGRASATSRDRRGARSELWGRILAAVLDRPLAYAPPRRRSAPPSVRPGWVASPPPEKPAEVCTPPPVERVIEPDPQLEARRLPRATRDLQAPVSSHPARDLRRARVRPLRARGATA